MDESICPVRVPVGAGFYVILNLPTEISLREDKPTYWLGPDDIDDLTATRERYRYSASTAFVEVPIVKAKP